MASVVFGGFEYAFDYVKDTLSELDGPESFVVFWTYDLVPSLTPELPVDPRLTQFQELAKQHPEGIGGWFTYEADGITRHAFRPDRD